MWSLNRCLTGRAYLLCVRLSTSLGSVMPSGALPLDYDGAKCAVSFRTRTSVRGGIPGVDGPHRGSAHAQNPLSCLTTDTSERPCRQTVSRRPHRSLLQRLRHHHRLVVVSKTCCGQAQTPKPASLVASPAHRCRNQLCSRPLVTGSSLLFGLCWAGGEAHPGAELVLMESEAPTTLVQVILFVRKRF